MKHIELKDGNERQIVSLCKKALAIVDEVSFTVCEMGRGEDSPHSLSFTRSLQGLRAQPSQ